MMTHEKIYLFAFSHCATVPFRFMEFIMLRLFFSPLQSRCCSTFIHKHEMLCFFSVLCSFSTLLQFFLLRLTFSTLLSISSRRRESPEFFFAFSSFSLFASPSSLTVRAEGMCRFDMTTLWVNRKTEHRKLLARLFETWTSGVKKWSQNIERIANFLPRRRSSSPSEKPPEIDSDVEGGKFFAKRKTV